MEVRFMTRRYWRPVQAVGLALLLAVVAFSPAHAASDPAKKSGLTYTNPLLPKIPTGGVVEDCPDPSIIRGQTSGDSNWYMFCTSDPLNDADIAPDGKDYTFHKMTMHESPDLVNWTYMGDVFTATNTVAWADPTAGYFAPDIHYFNGKYVLYFTVTDVTAATDGTTADCHNDSAIGVATSATPTGPWIATATPVVAPRPNGPVATCNFFATLDPAVTADEFGQLYMYYGSYYGGIQARPLAADGITATDPTTAVQITIPNRYEAAYIVKHDSYYYLFGSATNCCNGPLTGYSVFAGRSTTPLGPFVDREGVSLNVSRVGGTPVISMNGNRWLGPGHNAAFTDDAGQDWLLYHAVDAREPYFPDLPNRHFLTKRPVLMDRLDWVDGWPSVRAGAWASDTSQPAPVTQPGQKAAAPDKPVRDDRPGKLLPAFTDEFNTTTLASKWSWVRPPAATTSYGFDGDGTFRFNTQNADLYRNTNTASVLTEAEPKGNFVVETRLRLDVPNSGCCQNFTQAGLVIYKDDDNFIKLAHVSIFETRQTEFAKEYTDTMQGAFYGNTVVGPPDLVTYLRIVKRVVGSVEYYTPYTSRDGTTYVRGGTYTHALGTAAKIGLIAMGQDPNAPQFHANFDYVRVYSLAP